MSERWKDWFSQAKKDLKHSGNACKDGDYELGLGVRVKSPVRKGIRMLFQYNFPYL